MPAPMNRHHKKPSGSPTWKFETHKRPTEDTAAERAEKDRLIQEFLERKAAKAAANSSTDVNKT